MSLITLSICSQIKNRLYQLNKTFKYNYKIIESYKNIEWNIVDCCSTDGLENFMYNFFLDETISQETKNKIKYYRCINDTDYHIPIFKNFAARLSKNNYVFNLDIDNYLEDNLMLHVYGTGRGVCCIGGQKGTFGRIGCLLEHFKVVGGYDEKFMPAAIHESDFMSRSEKTGYFFDNIKCLKKPVQNSKEETTKNFKIKLKKRWAKNGKKILGDWREMYNINLEKSKYNLDNNIINPNKKYTKCSFLLNFKNKVELSEEF